MDASESASASPITRGQVLALLAMASGVIILANDFTALNVALPSIERDFDSEVSTVQWVINAYALVFGMLIVTGGRLADMFGRRRAFFLGAAVFASMSALGGAAQSDSWLIATRAAMGIGGALMWPAILGMTYSILPEQRAGLAGGLILGAAGVGQAMGPILGGALTDLASWRWIFFANVPIVAFAVLVTWREVHLTEERSREERIDYRGIAALSIGLVSLLFALDQSDAWGFGDPIVIGCLVLAAVMVTTFVLIEPGRGASALVPASVMRNRSFAAACAAIGLSSVTFFASCLYLPQFMQKTLGYSPLEAGLGLLPMMGLFALVSLVAGPLYDRLGPKLLVTAGAAFMGAGPVVFAFVDDGSRYGALVPGLVALGIGMGLFFSAATTAGITSLDSSHQSLAGGLVYMFQIAGGAVGLGICTAIFTAASGVVDGFVDVFRFAAALSIAAVLVSLLFVGGRLGGGSASAPAAAGAEAST